MAVAGRWVLLLFIAAGCGGEVRSFSVTLEEPVESQCRGVTRHSAIEQEVLDDIAEDTEEAFEDERRENPRGSVGRLLRLMERQHEVQAWFEVTDAHGDPIAYADPGAVYRGPPQDGFIEIAYRVVDNHDERDEDAGRELCGERLLSEGLLTVTDADGIQGRIRWRERTYLDAVSSRCLAWIECARNIELDGLEL